MSVAIQCMSCLFDLLSFPAAAYPDAVGAAAVGADVFPFRVDPVAFQKSFPEEEDQNQGEAFSAFLASVYSPEDVIRDISPQTLEMARAQVLKIYDEYMGRYGFRCQTSFDDPPQDLRRRIKERFSREYLGGISCCADLSSIKRSIEEVCFYIYMKGRASREHGDAAVLEDGSPIIEEIRRKFEEEDLHCTGGTSTVLSYISRSLLSEGNFHKLVADKKRELLKDVAVSILGYSGRSGSDDILQVHRVGGYTRRIVEDFNLLKDESDTGFWGRNCSDDELSRYRSEIFSSIRRDDFSMNFADRIAASMVSGIPYADPRLVGGDRYAEFIDSIKYELERLGFADRFRIIDVSDANGEDRPLDSAALGRMVFDLDPETGELINRYDRFLYFLKYAALYELGSAEVVEGRCGIFDNVTEPDIFKVPYICFASVALGHDISSDELLSHFASQASRSQAAVLMIETAVKFGYRIDSIPPEELSESLADEDIGYAGLVQQLVDRPPAAQVDRIAGALWEDWEAAEAAPPVCSGPSAFRIGVGVLAIGAGILGIGALAVKTLLGPGHLSSVMLALLFASNIGKIVVAACICSLVIGVGLLVWPFEECEQLEEREP